MEGTPTIPEAKILIIPTVVIPMIRLLMRMWKCLSYKSILR